jgi:cytoskeleton protein RodZ
VIVAVLAGLAFFFWPQQLDDDGRITEGLTIDRQPPEPQVEETTEPEPPVRNDRIEAVSPEEAQAALQSGEDLPLNLVIADIAPPTKRPDEPSTEPAVQPVSADESARTLVLMFDESSWADVRDAAGKRLLSQTVSEGASIDLVGEPPFTVFLGNADGVRVKYMGRIQTYSQGNKGLFARFTVGKER